MISCPPVPSSIPTLALTTLKKGSPLYRVGVNSYPANAWDARSLPRADFRFSPLTDSKGDAVPVSYCGTTEDVAILETILRFEVPGGVIETSSLAGKFLAEVVLTRDVRLIPLEGPAARPLGEGIATAIGQCPASDYGETRSWASRFRATHPKADGIVWISRQEMKNSALILWKREGEETAPLQVIEQVGFDVDRVQAQFQRLAQIVRIRVI